jgi:hypothetical protein
MVTKTVRKRTEAEVHTWRFGEDAPEGFDVVTASDNKRSAVKRDGADVARNHEGYAVAIPEGGALIVHPNGTHTTVGPKFIPKPVALPDGNVRWETEMADNDDGIREALRSYDYDPADLDTADEETPVYDEETPVYDETVNDRGNPDGETE